MALIRKNFNFGKPYGTRSFNYPIQGSAADIHTLARFMSQKDIIIPKKLPTPEVAVNLFVEFRDKSLPLLAGLSLMQLMGNAQDVDRIWIVGSTAWRPAVFGRYPAAVRDIDIVFGVAKGAEEFITQAKQLLERATNGGVYTIKDKVPKGEWTGTSLSKKATDHPFLDAWDLPEGQTIAEHIMGFEQDHERCAITLGALRGEIGALTRIVRPSSHNKIIKVAVPTTERDWFS